MAHVKFVTCEICHMQSSRTIGVCAQKEARDNWHETGVDETVYFESLVIDYHWLYSGSINISHNAWI